jgi:hypothetical protein
MTLPRTVFSRSIRLSALTLLASLGTARLALADDASADASPQRVFDPGYYAAFAPQSALDMVAQTPGFSIKEGDNRRGMGAGGANVVIDNRHIVGKSVSARESLSRIAADRVVRIELLDATQLALPGLSGQVVNVVTRQADMSGRWEWDPEIQEGDKAQLARGRLVISGQAGDWEYNLGLSSFGWGGHAAGSETLYDSSGAAVEFRDEMERWKGRRHEFSGQFSTESEAGDISNIALVLAASEDARQEHSFRTGALAADHLRTFNFANDGESLKLSGDHEFAVGPGRLKVIGLRSNASSAPVTATALQQLTVAQAPEGARVLVDRESGESILRGEYTWVDDAGDWQMAVEGAVNTLDTATSLATLSADGSYVDQPLSGGTSHVEEKRTEAALVHGRELAEGVFMQASVAAEYSEIAQTGPNGKVREFVRPKGFVAVSWAPAAEWSASVKLERAVGQLDFGDFVSSVNLSDETGQQQSGNPEVVPEQSWSLALEANGEAPVLGPVRVKVFGRQIEDVNGAVLFSRTVNDDGSISVVEGPGNLDTAVTYGLDLSGTLAMGEIGVPGGKLDWSASLRDSSISDPVTGAERPVSGTRLSHYELRFRQDLPGTPWAWGVGYETQRNTAGYGVTQLTLREDTPGKMGAFVQHKDFIGMNARLSVSNLMNSEERFTRIAYSGTVSDPVNFIEDRTRAQGLQVGLNLSGTF